MTRIPDLSGHTECDSARQGEIHKLNINPEKDNRLIQRDTNN